VCLRRYVTAALSARVESRYRGKRRGGELKVSASVGFAVRGLRSSYRCVNVRFPIGWCVRVAAANSNWRAPVGVADSLKVGSIRIITD